MASPLRLLAALALTASVTTAASAADPAPPAGFTVLFNGKDTTGWHGWAMHGKGGVEPLAMAALSPADRAAKFAEFTADAKQHWSVDNGELVNDGHGAYLATDADYGDAELLIEYKTVPAADSGVYLRSTPQVQIWDHTQKKEPKPGREPEKGSGGLFNNTIGAPGRTPLVLADKPFGQWNSFRIVQVGARTWVWFNGQLTVDGAIMENFWDKTRQTPLYRTGAIVLQTHGGEIRWRNIFLRKIDSAEGTKILKARTDHTGFESIFNGKDFTGWKGPVENYTVTDHAVMCQPKKGGTVYYDKELTDFAARLEFKLPPAGNNGLAIRYPGTGDTAYVGMCELQVLDTEDPKYTKLDPRQAHGSAYGMVAATRGYLRPVGEWNYEEVTVKGSTINVELNGTPILNADLSKVTETMANKAHPGKDRTSGYFGFAGHSDPVQFRDVEIKELPAAK